MLNRALVLIREYHELKQCTLAALLGVSSSHLSEIESGKTQITLALLMKYGKVFVMPISSIMYLSEKLMGKTDERECSALCYKMVRIIEWANEVHFNNAPLEKRRGAHRRRTFS